MSRPQKHGCTESAVLNKLIDEGGGGGAILSSENT